MSSIDDGGPAFPVGPGKGMTLRDWFAGQALAGAVASMANGETYPFAADYRDGSEEPADIVARECYWLADAMIAARGGSK